MKTKYYGGYAITEAMGYAPIDYNKITSLLNLVNVPMVRNEKGAQTYCLSKKQVEFLKLSLEKIKEGLSE